MMISLQEARARILDAIEPLAVETVNLDQALGRVVASPVQALLDIPRFDNASVDGYAVRTRDLRAHSNDPTARSRDSGSESSESSESLSEMRPIRLPVHSRVAAAGDPPLEGLPDGTCARIFTGAPLPPGTDAVVMQEDTRAEPPGWVTLLASVTPWEGVRFAGEDVRRGSPLASAGQRLRPAHLGLLAAAGVGALKVRRRPRITLLTTGNELVEPSADVPPGKLPDSNRFLLRALAERSGACVARGAWVPDDLEAIMGALGEAAATSDLVVTTGGVSVGDADLLKSAFTRLGGRLDLWRIAVKPGKPFAWGRLGNCHWFGLPGNPVAVFATWQVLVLPALRRFEADQELVGRVGIARLSEPVTNRGDRLHLLRVHVDSKGSVRPIGMQASHIQSGLAAANALLHVPAGSAWETGREVEVEWID
ncbi:MAG: gephyrin-like molybdotransferase Glp [Limisphaerales bacterium]